eukprot:4048864-Prorocentrum_lima.AAC.1
MQVQALMTEREPVGELLGTMTGLKNELHHLQQDFTIMKDNVISELAVLEGQQQRDATHGEEHN